MLDHDSHFALLFNDAMKHEDTTKMLLLCMQEAFERIDVLDDCELPGLFKGDGSYDALFGMCRMTCKVINGYEGNGDLYGHSARKLRTDLLNLMLDDKYKDSGVSP